MGTPKETQPLTVFAFGKYWARPLKNENRHVRTISIAPQKTFLEKFFAELFFKKATTPRRSAPAQP